MCLAKAYVGDNSERELLLEEIASLKTAPKPGESLVAFGDIDGDSFMEIVQAVGNNLYVIEVEE